MREKVSARLFLIFPKFCVDEFEASFASPSSSAIKSSLSVLRIPPAQIPLPSRYRHRVENNRERKR
jgi:hypothetical protein